MKILLINNFHYRKGGSEAVYFNTAQILRKNGHEVIFFSTEDANNEECEQSSFFIKQNNKISKIKGIVNYFYNVEAKRKLKQLIITERPDIAHVHLFWGGISPSIFGVLKRYGIPLVHTAHDYRMVCPAYAFKANNGKICEECQGKHFYKCIYNRCSKDSLIQSVVMAAEMYLRNTFFNPLKNIDGFIFVSNFSRDKHIQYSPGFANVRSMVLYNTSPENKQREEDHRDSYFLFFGRLSYEKGIKTLIAAAIAMPNIRLKIVGVGPMEDILKEMVNASDVDNIEFMGYKTGDELTQIVSNAYFVIVPSECYENNPMTIVESYSFGIPVIGSRIGGIPEIIEDDKTGWIFIPGDVNDLKNKIGQAHALNKNDYQQMSQCAKEFAQNNFEESDYYRKLLYFYNQILNRNEHI